MYIWIVRLIFLGVTIGIYVAIGPSEPCHGSIDGTDIYICESEPIDIYLGEHTECYYIYGWECP